MAGKKIPRLRRIFLFVMMHISFLIFADSRFDEEFKSLSVKARTDVFLTRTESCYALELAGILPGEIQMELPDLPPGTHFASSKKEEFISSDGRRGTLITFWFVFDESGVTRLSPLLVRTSGKSYYFDFEQVTVHENPAMTSPVLEAVFAGSAMPVADKSGRKTLVVKRGEKITFTLRVRHCAQILDFKWSVPKDSIFTEVRRFDFSDGARKSAPLTNEARSLSRFEWQILKEGSYSLPEFLVTAVSLNGSKKQLSLSQDTEIVVTNERHMGGSERRKNNAALASAFERQEDDSIVVKNAPTREECAFLAGSERRSFFQRITGRRYAIFSGGKITAVPEERINGRQFDGGQKVRVVEDAGDWQFIECPEFSGWTKRENLFEIK